MGRKKKEEDVAATTEPSQQQNKNSDIIDQYGEDVFVSGQYIIDRERTIVSISPQIDGMLGGGVQFGSFVIPTGPPKVGKTSLALTMAANALQIPLEDGSRRKLFFFNIEGRLNRRDLIGIHDMKRVLEEHGDSIQVIQSRKGLILTAENYLEIGERLINENPGCVFIFDSFSQLCSKAGRENEWDGKQFRDDVPKFLSLFCKRICNVIPINQCIVVGITHQIANTGFGFSPWSEASGNKVQYQVDVKLHAKFCQPWKIGETKIGQEINWECFCSPLLNGPTDTKCISKLRYGYGIDKPAELVDVAVDLGIIKKGGAWYTYKDNKYQGLEQIRNFIAENPQEYTDIHKQYREMMGLPNASV